MIVWREFHLLILLIHMNLRCDRIKFKLLASAILCGVLFACTGNAPVQEMSNARQTLQTAKTARADLYAQDKYSRAKGFLDEAANHLNSGDFNQARQLALKATLEAKQAHLDAINGHKK